MPSSIAYEEAHSIDSNEEDTNRLSQTAHNNAEGNSNDSNPPPRFFHYVPRLFCVENSIEATAISFNTFARAIILMASAFIGPGLLGLAKAEAVRDCDINTPECIESARVYGFLPSSLLTNIATVSGLVSALILPPTGAMIDYTSYRRSVGLYASLGMSIIKVVEIWISSKTWFAMASLQLISAILFQLSTVTEYAYSAELTSCPQQQSKYQSFFFLVMFISFVLYTLEVLIPGKLYALDDVGTARLGAILSSIWTVPLFAVTWLYLFPKRKALRRVPTDQTLWTAGFKKLYHTFQMIGSSLPAVYWFLLSSMCCGSANWSINTVAITYFKEFLQLSSQNIGLVILTMLISGIPGTFVGKYVSLKFNPIISCKICLFLFIVIISAASLQLSSAKKDYAFLFGSMLGVCKGWLHPIQNALYVTIIPKGQEVEMMGVYVFCFHIFAFLPPLFFTFLNEEGFSMRWGMASINLFFAFGLMFLHQIKDYEEARSQGEAVTQREANNTSLVTSDRNID